MQTFSEKLLATFVLFIVLLLILFAVICLGIALYSLGTMFGILGWIVIIIIGLFVFSALMVFWN